MTFEEILDHAIAMLQRRGRLTYRTLKLQFHLDDEHLEALKDELIYGQRLAVDEDDRVLVWTGSADTPPSSQPIPQPTVQEAALSQTALASAAPSPPDAERRQLTVMFCDVVDSTALSAQLDPEDLREVVRAYHQVCSDVITRFDGYIAQLLGDGLLVYFGYPQAHEDDAQRAVRTGLGLLAAMGELNSRLQQEHGVQLAIRLGVHTGLVVVGAMGGPGRQEQLALGEVPNIASRIQGLAEPNTVAISAATYRLVQGFFDCQAWGAQTLRGVSQPLNVYRILGESGVHSRLDLVNTRGLTPLVGREHEVGLLLERWEQVKTGHGHVVLLTGEAGIGKSRLVQRLKDHVTNEPHIRWECRSAEYSQNTALFPLTDFFQRLLRFHAEESPDEKFEKLEQALSQYRLPLDESVPLFAPLLSLSLPESRYAPLNVSPQRQRQKTLEAIVTILLEHAERQPVLFILEDVHWTDPTTLEFLTLMLDQTPTASVLTVLTCRPTFQPRWTHRSFLTEVSVTRLAQPHIAPMITHVAGGKTLPPVVMQQLIERTDGVPLFVEEMTKGILESGALTAVDDHYELTGSFSTFAIPATLQDSLMARLDRLVTAKAVAQYAAVIGRHFAYDLLSTVSQLDAATLQHELGRLVEAEMVYQRGVPPQATYLFKHALIQDAAYQSLLKSTRQHYHQRIAEVLEARFPETVATQPEVLAHHYTEAGQGTRAIAYWQQAGEHALQRSANLEAVSHLRRGLTVLATLPETQERVQQERGLQITLGSALSATKGYGAPEVETAYTRAYELSQHVGDALQMLPVLWGLWYFAAGRTEYARAQALGEHLLQMGQRLQDAILRLEGHTALGVTLLFLGEVAQARWHLEQSVALYDPQHRALAFLYGIDYGLLGHVCLGWQQLVQGYPSQGLQHSEAALRLAQEVAHPYTLASILTDAAFVYMWRREVQPTRDQTETVSALATEQGFTLRAAHSALLHGWALVMQGEADGGLAQIRQALSAIRATGAMSGQSFFLGLFVEACGHAGQIEEGLHAVEEALAHVDRTGERLWEAELHRLKGELLGRHATVPEDAAETCFQQALAVAQGQGARWWELRAAMSLARLWQQQGKRAAAQELLAPIYGWFTEGFDTADLHEAKALLDALA